MHLLAQPLVALCVLILLTVIAHYMWIQFQVGKLRIATGLAAPAVTGDPDFERAYRVQANSVEQLAVFLPCYMILLLVTGLKGNDMFMWVTVALGLLYLLGRVIYARGYMADPSKRGPGAMISFGVNFLILLALVIQFLMYLF